MPLRSCVFVLDHLFCPKERVGWVLLELLRKKNKEGAVIIMFIVHALLQVPLRLSVCLQRFKEITFKIKLE